MTTDGLGQLYSVRKLAPVSIQASEGLFLDAEWGSELEGGAREESSFG